MTKSTTLAAPRPRRWTPTHSFYAVLIVLVAAPILISLIDNPAGPYLAAYVSTALVMFGLYELARRIMRRRPIGRIWAVLGGGLVTGLFVNLATILGPDIYLIFLVGQALTVAVVLWLVRATTAAPGTPGSPVAASGPARMTVGARGPGMPGKDRS